VADSTPLAELSGASFTLIDLFVVVTGPIEGAAILSTIGRVKPADPGGAIVAIKAANVCNQLATETLLFHASLHPYLTGGEVPVGPCRAGRGDISLSRSATSVR